MLYESLLIGISKGFPDQRWPQMSISCRFVIFRNLSFQSPLWVTLCAAFVAQNWALSSAYVEELGPTGCQTSSKRFQDLPLEVSEAFWDFSFSTKFSSFFRPHIDESAAQFFSPQKEQDWPRASTVAQAILDKHVKIMHIENKCKSFAPCSFFDRFFKICPKFWSVPTSCSVTPYYSRAWYTVHEYALQVTWTDACMLGAYVRGCLLLYLHI